MKRLPDPELMNSFSYVQTYAQTAFTEANVRLHLLGDGSSVSRKRDLHRLGLSPGWYYQQRTGAEFRRHRRVAADDQLETEANFYA